MEDGNDTPKTNEESNDGRLSVNRRRFLKQTSAVSAFGLAGLSPPAAGQEGDSNGSADIVLDPSTKDHRGLDTVTVEVSKEYTKTTMTGTLAQDASPEAYSVRIDGLYDKDRSEITTTQDMESAEYTPEKATAVIEAVEPVSAVGEEQVLTETEEESAGADDVSPAASWERRAYAETNSQLCDWLNRTDFRLNWNSTPEMTNRWYRAAVRRFDPGECPITTTWEFDGNGFHGTTEAGTYVRSGAYGNYWVEDFPIDDPNSSNHSSEHDVYVTGHDDGTADFTATLTHQGPFAWLLKKDSGWY